MLRLVPVGGALVFHAVPNGTNPGVAPMLFWNGLARRSSRRRLAVGILLRIKTNNRDDTWEPTTLASLRVSDEPFPPDLLCLEDRKVAMRSAILSSRKNLQQKPGNRSREP